MHPGTLIHWPPRMKVKPVVLVQLEQRNWVPATCEQQSRQGWRLPLSASVSQDITVGTLPTLRKSRVKCVSWCTWVTSEVAGAFAVGLAWGTPLPVEPLANCTGLSGSQHSQKAYDDNPHCNYKKCILVSSQESGDWFVPRQDTVLRTTLAC